MSSPEWYITLASKLKSYFDKNLHSNSVSGEQFLRNFLIENPVESYNEEDEDDMVEEHLEAIQNYLSGLDWVIVDQGSFRWLRQPHVPITLPTELVQEPGVCNTSRLDDIFKNNNELDSVDIEWAKDELLIENCDFNNKEALRYKLAKAINKHENYTPDDRAEAWFLAAAISSSTGKYVECLGHASDFKAMQYKFEEAASYLEKAIYRLEPTLEASIGLSKVKRRVIITFQKRNDNTYEQVLRLIRKCRLFYEQAGNRSKSSRLFVLETDIDKRNKNYFYQSVMFFYWLFAEYGESPVRVLLSSVMIIIIWAFIYSCMGISYNLTTGDAEVNKIATNVYFSIVTFTTLGYGDFSPPGEGRIIASIQALLGLFMTSLFLVTFVRRYSR